MQRNAMHLMDTNINPSRSVVIAEVSGAVGAREVFLSSERNSQGK